MEREVDFGKDCSVYILYLDDNGKSAKLVYERPQSADDKTLTNEALYIFEDCKRGGVGKAAELVAVFIARNENQASEINAESIRIPKN